MPDTQHRMTTVTLPAILEIQIPEGCANPEGEALARLDQFRESVLPHENHAITILHEAVALALDQAKKALEGDSNDEEHDALLRLVEVMAPAWELPDWDEETHQED